MATASGFSERGARPGRYAAGRYERLRNLRSRTLGIPTINFLPSTPGRSEGAPPRNCHGWGRARSNIELVPALDVGEVVCGHLGSRKLPASCWWVSKTRDSRAPGERWHPARERCDLRRPLCFDTAGQLLRGIAASLRASRQGANDQTAKELIEAIANVVIAHADDDGSRPRDRRCRPRRHLTRGFRAVLAKDGHHRVMPLGKALSEVGTTLIRLSAGIGAAYGKLLSPSASIWTRQALSARTPRTSGEDADPRLMALGRSYVGQKTCSTFWCRCSMSCARSRGGPAGADRGGRTSRRWQRCRWWRARPGCVPRRTQPGHMDPGARSSD